MKNTCINHGFTLVELMVVVLLTGIISIGLFSAYHAQSTSFVIQEDVAEMQQRVRAGMDMMTMELREAAYDPNITGKPEIKSADSSGNISFTIVNDVATNAETTLTYSFDDTDTPADLVPDCITRKVNTSTAMDLIEGVDIVEFLFIDDNGNPLPPLVPPAVYTAAQLASIRGLTISTLVRAAKPDPKLVQNRTYTLASGTVTPAFSDQFRRRLLITSVQFRNLGLIFN